jgi:hypothetical protein
MSRILVGQTIGRGYRFLFRRFFAILGLSWLPALALGVVGILWLGHFAADVSLVSKGAAATYWLALDVLALFVALTFFVATIAVPVTREALGLHDETVFAHFVVGRRELRLFLALLRFGLLLFTAAVLLTLALGFAVRMGLPVLLTKMGAASESTAAWHGIALRALVLGGTGFVLVATLAFLALRLGFFLAPIAAIEEHARVTRAWILSSRNSWRVLIVSLALAVPVDLLARGAEYALFGRQLQALLPQALATHDPAALMSWMAAHAAAFAAIGSTVLTLLIALFAGASAMAYRTLMPAADMQPVWQPAERETVEDAPMLPAMPAIAAPPLDVTLGDHQAYVAEAPIHHDTEAHAAEQPIGTEASAPSPEPTLLPEAIAVGPVPADHALASEAAASTQAAMDDALPDPGETQHTVLDLSDEATATPEENAGGMHPEQGAQAESAVHAASAEPVTDVIENILPTGDPEIAPKERALEPVE